MKPETALKLVSDYSALTRAIRECKKEIGQHLDQCNGLKGFRRETEFIPPDEFLPEGYTQPTARSNGDQETHLKGWYTPETVEDHWGGEGRLDYLEIGEDESDECPHCYAAHLVIQKRKALRRSLGAVKSAMTRLGAQ
ncbi:hypothetical protein [Achromobacter insolitus]|uniref:Uncharacterized protein n=1 Tax=Achromobacter insolitus TaxID=217204 RepID=A0A6S7F8T8_9BURK|nr:hypothetical protein [Achromobacter insolitus]CAB3931564.1 hypothetical protein LMG6000_02217 [Achromobacter insolitus]CAB3939435.1 hypothetical protein LMG5997_04034 [Achromobacter insolitus]